MRTAIGITLLVSELFGILTLLPGPEHESTRAPDPSDPGTAIVNARVFDGRTTPK